MSDTSEFYGFYQNQLKQFGASAKGVGWKNEEAQIIRFKQLYALMAGHDHGSFSINDLGCGVGDFVKYVLGNRGNFTYIGYDIMPEMIQNARLNYANDTHVSFQHIQHADEMVSSDYTIASGIFNIRFNVSDADWQKQIIETLTIMNNKSARGFAFNILSSYSHVEYQKKELYYAEPGFLFDYCKRYFSKNVALLHDYDQYDFTIIVRK